MAELFSAGDHDPVMLLVDVVGKVNDPPEHIGATWVNVGVIDVLDEFIVATTVTEQLMADVTMHEYVPGQRLDAVAEF